MISSLNSRGNLATSLSLSSNDRIYSFIWIRGSKHCFLTSFSHFYRYFLFLVFLRHHYLLVSLHLSFLHGTPISYPVFIPFILWIPRCTCAPMNLAHITRFLKVRHSWEPGTRVSTGILSPFRLFFPEVSCANVHWAIAYHTFYFCLNPQTDIFLCDISLHQVNAVQPGTGIYKGFPTLWIRLNVACLKTAARQLLKCSLHLIAFQLVPYTLFHSIVRTFLATKSFTASSSMDPCHMARFLKSVPRNIVLQSAIVPNCLEAQWVWRAWVGADCSTPLFLQSSCSSGILRLLLLMMSESGVCL